jgi:hypothetical protein
MRVFIAISRPSDTLLARDGGCSMSLLFHNIRSAKGANLELLEAEMRMWAVPWDVVGLVEMWLDAEIEKRVVLGGYVVECASWKNKGRVGWRCLFRRD